MGHSYRRQPYTVYAGNSQKKDKRICNRIMRRHGRVALLARGDEAMYLRHTEALDRWSMSQDDTRHYSSWLHYQARIRSYGSEPDYRSWYRWVKAK